MITILYFSNDQVEFLKWYKEATETGQCYNDAGNITAGTRMDWNKNCDAKGR